MCKLEENYSQLLCGDRLGRKRKTLEKSAITWLGKVIVTRVNMLQRRKLASSDPGQGPGAVSCEYGKELRGCINGIAEHHRHFRNYVARRWAVTAAHLSTPQNFVGPFTDTKTMHTWVYCCDITRSTAHPIVTQFSVTNLQTYVTFNLLARELFF